MNDSWIALVNESGLTFLKLEQQHSLPFMFRRATREEAECFWVVLTRQHARFIQQRLLLHDAIGALAWLNRLATATGRISPPKPPTPEWLGEYVTIPDYRDREWSS